MMLVRQSAVLFEQFVSGGYPALERAKVEGQRESLYLEFKANRPPGKQGHAGNNLTTLGGHLTDKGRAVFAQALSGFANADGGVVVWGVSCRKHDGFDTVDALIPIAGLRQFEEALNSLTDQLVSPPVQGVVHHPIKDPGAEDTGFIATHIPRAELSVHMAVGPDQHCFFRRGQNGFRYMEQYEVADAFSRRPAPNLELIHSLHEGGRTDKACLIAVKLGIRNVGTALAHHPALAIYRSGGAEIDTTDSPLGGHLSGMTYRPAAEKWQTIHGQSARFDLFTGDSGSPLYPGVNQWVAITKPKTVPFDRFILTSMLVSYELFADGFYRQGELQVSLEEFQQFWNTIRPLGR